MQRIAAKFGGTSVASSEQIKKLEAIVRADARRSVVVVSAPGKRQKSEAKITDLLYLCQDMAQVGADLSGPLGTMKERFVGIERELGVDVGMSRLLGEFAADLKAGVSRDYVAARGECWNGLLIAKYLGAVFVDPLETIHILSSGLVDPKSYELLGKALSDTSKTYVIPGFYGRGPDGKVKTFSRGGSDISGAIAARAIHAEVYENWTDVSGFLMTDPRIVKDPLPMLEVTYRELRELSYMGASVLHDEATLPVREAGIPIQIKNTNEPSHPGTRIVSKLSEDEEKSTAIAGIAGRVGFSMIAIDKSLMNKEVGFAHRLLGIFVRRGISIEHMPSSIDGINVIVDTVQLGEQAEDVMAEIRETLHADKVTLVPDLALIAIVGEGMNHSIGISARVFGALGRAGTNVRVINQGASEVNIIVGVAPADFEKSVSALYEEFIPTQRRSIGPQG